MSFYHRYCGQRHDYAFQARDCEENTLMGRDRRPGTDETHPRRVPPARPAVASRPPTPPMVRFIRGLAEERVVPVAGRTPDEANLCERLFDLQGWGADEYNAERDKFVSFQEGKALIEWMKEMPHKQTAEKGDQADVPAGRYALTGADGQVRFYQVDRPTEGKWKGYTFTKLLLGQPGDFRKERLQRTVAQQILRAIGGDIQGALRLFGYKAKQCGLCHSPLSTPESRAAGYGPVCAAKHGLWYPSRSEALAILDELGEDADDSDMADAD